MAFINKQDTDGTKPQLLTGELGLDCYVAGNDEGRVYVGYKTENIPLARLDEINLIDNTPDAQKNVLSATKLTTARNIDLNGDVTASGTFDGSSNLTLTATLTNSGVSNGTYGDGANIPVVNVDSKGRITSITTTPVASSSNSLYFNGDVIGAGLTGTTVTLTLAQSYSLSTHNHDSAYLGITAQATDSAMLGGQLPSYYSVSTHNHDTTYAPIVHNHDSAYLGITATATNSDKLDGKHYTDILSDIMAYAIALG